MLPTDTVYGIVARAADQAAVESVYRLRGRSSEKPCIMLVADVWQITDNELWTPQQKALADKYWPGPLSLVAPVSQKTPEYLHRGTHTLAYRIPHYLGLRNLISKTGPLIAPSANLEGKPVATTLQEAQKIFGNKVDGYVEGGLLADHAPSTVVAIKDGKVHILRQGALRIL